MWRKLSYRVTLLVALFPLLAGAQCFPRQCRSHEHCQRLCECSDTSTNTFVQCPMFFRCDTQAGVCADEYNMSCDEVCQRFAASGLCGSKTCDNEAECVREVVCKAVDSQSGQPVCEFGCPVTFRCEQDVGACEAAFADPTTPCPATCPVPTDGSCG